MSISTIVKATTKGQVTLPVRWRRRFETSRFLIKEQGETLVITPFDMDEAEDERWETIFDAKEHNNGKGVPVDDFIKILKRTV